MDLENKRVDSDFGPLKLVVKQGWGFQKSNYMCFQPRLAGRLNPNQVVYDMRQ